MIDTCQTLIFVMFSGADLIVEVAHPVITETYGEKFLHEADYMVNTNNIYTLVVCVMLFPQFL